MHAIDANAFSAALGITGHVLLAMSLQADCRRNGQVCTTKHRIDLEHCSSGIHHTIYLREALKYESSEYKG